MNKKIEFIQAKLLSNLDRLDKEDTDIQNEVARSNAISQLANTYIKTCNLIIRVEESKDNVKNKFSEMNNDETLQ